MVKVKCESSLMKNPWNMAGGVLGLNDLAKIKIYFSDHEVNEVHDAKGFATTIVSGVTGYVATPIVGMISGLLTEGLFWSFKKSNKHGKGVRVKFEIYRHSVIPYINSRK